MWHRRAKITMKRTRKTVKSSKITVVRKNIFRNLRLFAETHGN